jgi:hypothetical protein
MLFGHNSDVKVDTSVYHVQTEDRGTTTALIDTTVYLKGRVVHRRTNSYRDLLPLDHHREKQLRERIDAQHRLVAEELRSGKLKFADAPGGAPAPAPVQKPAAPSTTPTPPAPLNLELLNARSWLAGKRANLQIAVRQPQSGAGLPGAKILVRIDGSATKSEFSAQTGPDGKAQVEFDMPSLNSHQAALVIEAVHGVANGQLRFQLRAKPRVPAG